MWTQRALERCGIGISDSQKRSLSVERSHFRQRISVILNDSRLDRSATRSHVLPASTNKRPINDARLSAMKATSVQASKSVGPNDKMIPVNCLIISTIGKKSAITINHNKRQKNDHHRLNDRSDPSNRIVHILITSAIRFNISESSPVSSPTSIILVTILGKTDSRSIGTASASPSRTLSGTRLIAS